MKVTMNLQGILQTPAIVQWTSRCISCKITHSSSLSCGYPKRSSLSCGKKKKKKTHEKRGKRDDMWTHLYYPGTQRFPFSKTQKKKQKFRLTESDGNCWGKSEKGKLLDFTQQYATDTHNTFCRWG
jgi:hypothetical protein